MTKNIHEETGSVVVVIDGVSDAVLKELERIKGAGLLYPEKVLEEAKSKTSPLHDEFKWDDSVAGNLYRLAQARALIACVKVTYPNMEPVRYFPHVRTDRKGYRGVSEVRNIEQLRKSYLCQFVSEIESLISKYKTFAELGGEVKALADLLARVQKKLTPKMKKAA